MLSSRFSIMPFPIPAISAMAYELIKPDWMRMPIQPNCAHMPLRPVPACKTRRDTRWNTGYRNGSAAEVELVELVAYVAAEVPPDLPVQSPSCIPIAVRGCVGGNACRIWNAQKKGEYPAIVRIADV